MLDVTDGVSSPASEAPLTSVPFVRLSRPSQTSVESETLALASADEDFARLAKARYAPMHYISCSETTFACLLPQVKSRHSSVQSGCR